MRGELAPIRTYTVKPRLAELAEVGFVQQLTASGRGMGAASEEEAEDRRNILTLN